MIICGKLPVFVIVLCGLCVSGLSRLAAESDGATPAPSTQAFALAPSAGNSSLSWVQRYDLRRRVDGKYLGIFYGRNQGVLDMDAAGGFERDEFFSAQSLSDTRGKAVALEDRRYTSWQLWPDGMLAPRNAGKTATGTAASLYPEGSAALDPYQPGRFELEPFLDPRQHPVGEAWKQTVLFCLMPDQPESWRWCIPQELTLVNQGLLDWKGRQVWEFKANCTLQGRLPGAAEFKRWPSLAFMQAYRPLPGLKAFAGKRELRVLVDAVTLAPVFMQERLDAQTIGLDSGRKIQNDGFVLTFYEGFTGDLGNRINEDALALKKQVEDIRPEIEASDSRVTMRTSPGGLVLEIPDLGFVADKAEFLPGEQARLVRLAKVLAGLEGPRFLVRGHTALWGSRESQESLALERARLVSRVLQEAGLEPDRLMFEGCGAREPKADNETPEGRAKNRRVEIVIIRGPGAR